MADGEMTPRAIHAVLTRMVLQQAEMEARLARMEAIVGAGTAAASPPASVPAPELVAEAVAPPPLVPLPVPPPPPTADANLEARVGLQWLNRIGVVTLILGIGFAFKTATDNGWIGPSARVGLGAFAGLVALVAGDRLWARNHAVFAQGLIGLALAIFYLVPWAAFSLYQLVPQPVAFALMAATTLGSAALALRFNAQAIAVLALFGGFATPVVLASGAPHPLIFLGYLALLDAGVLALARRRAWLALESLAALGTIALYAGWLVVSARPEDQLVGTVLAFVLYGEMSAARTTALGYLAQAAGSAALLALWPDPTHALPLLVLLAAAGLAVGVGRRREGVATWTLACLAVAYAAGVSAHAVPEVAVGAGFLTLAFGLFVGWTAWAHLQRRRALVGADAAVIVGNAIAYVGAMSQLLAPIARPELGAFVVVVAAVHLGLAWVTRVPVAPNARPVAPELAVGVGVTCFALAVPIELTGFAVLSAWALQGAAFVWLARRFAPTAPAFGPGKLAALGTLLFVIVACALGISVGVTVHVDPDGLARVALGDHPRTLAFGVLAASLLAAARWYPDRARAAIAYVAAHVAVLLGVGLELVGWTTRHDPDAALETATIAISIGVALYALALVTFGVVRRRVLDRVLGLALLGLVIAKLYVSDVWILGHAFRITAFLGLGVVLLLVSYLYSRYRTSLERLWRPDDGNDATRT